MEKKKKRRMIAVILDKKLFNARHQHSSPEMPQAS
jgi:hypothetical protein